MTAEIVPSFDDIDAALATAAPDLSGDEQRLAVATYRLLATGSPVMIEAAADATGFPIDTAAETLRSWPGVFRDGEDRIIGFWGLALPEMTHRVRLGDVDLYAWCAWDPLFLALIVGDLEVRTDDPISRDTVSYRSAAEGTVSELSHPDGVLSFLRPNEPWDDDVMDTFCHYVLHFTDPTSAGEWTSRHPGTFTIRLDDGVALARRHVARTFGHALA